MLSQHAYWARSGTDAASLNIINALEMLLEIAGRIGLSSFDFKRAFDSVSKMLARLALVRFGCPPALVEYLVNQDIGGLIMIRSPLTQHLLEKLTKLAAQHGVSITDSSLRDHPLFKFAFMAERRLAQG